MQHALEAESEPQAYGLGQQAGFVGLFLVGAALAVIWWLLLFYAAGWGLLHLARMLLIILGIGHQA